ncbi:hypothetical protein [Archangium lipolyticum]|uniref:hypothetical protein n=1 Tax=Archangium lipolyticum TaxID=2970465 RepID=UPI00214A32DB|nr:hypothetical protein [Archangium lipolyticum]
MKSFVAKRGLFTCLVASSVVLGGAACGLEAELDETGSEVGEVENPLTVTKAAAGEAECTATVSINRVDTSLVSSCQVSCKRDGALNLRLHIQKKSETGTWSSVAFGSLGTDARTGGTVNATAPNQPTGIYRAQCWVDHSEQTVHQSSYVYAGGNLVF